MVNVTEYGSNFCDIYFVHRGVLRVCWKKTDHVKFRKLHYCYNAFFPRNAPDVLGFNLAND